MPSIWTCFTGDIDSRRSVLSERIVTVLVVGQPMMIA